MRLGCIGILIGLALCAGGGQGLYTSLASGSERTVTYDELVRDTSMAGWYKVSDASWALQDAISLSGALGTKEDLYIPATPVKAGDGKIHLLVHVNDGALAAEAASLFKLPAEAQTKRLADSAALFSTKHPIEGTLEFGIESNDKDLDPVKRALGEELASDYKVIELGATPQNPWGSAAILLVGLAILAAMGIMTFRGGDSDAAAG